MDRDFYLPESSPQSKFRSLYKKNHQKISKTKKVTGTQSYSEDYYGGGPSFGVSLASRLSAIDPNLSVRIGAVNTDYMTANVFGIGGNNVTRATDRSGHDSEVTGSALSARAGLQYSFFDVNSLF